MLKSLWGTIFIVGCMTFLGACTDSDPSGDPTDAADAADATDPVEPPAPSVYCPDQGFTSTDFQTGTGGYLFGDLAEDFTVNQLSGKSFTLSEEWTGCDSYIFFSYFTFNSADAEARMESLWNSDLAGIIQSSARNVHYFFISSEFSIEEREERMGAMRAKLWVALNNLFADQPEEYAFWESRFHFVTDKLTTVSGSVGGYVNDFISYVNTSEPVDLGDRGVAYAPYPYSFAIGRDQTWDPTGSLSEYVGGPENLKMVAFNGAFFNHRAELKARLAAEADITVVPMIDEMVTSRVFNRDVTFPDAAAMAGMDTMEIDVEITCPHRNPFACSEWDRIALIRLCTEYDAGDIETCTASSEVVRWITPYWRRGRRHWVMDASPFLGLVQEGGAQRFRIEMGPGWERGTERKATMSVRLSNKNKGMKSRSVERAFGGGGFNADYNSTKEPFTFTPPTDATRVEIVTIISGHGQTDGDNCAEWCNHEHYFTVNGSTNRHEVTYVDIGNPVGCAARADEGVVPGQWGNWSQSRAGWCPGLPVETVRFDITSEVTLGSENTLAYEASFNGNTPAGGDISKNTYIVWYQD